jgi:uncharacterized repeat protein (TIGR01451 family)
MKKTRTFVRRTCSFVLTAAALLSGPAALAWPDLALTLSGPATASAGDSIGYTLVYTNKGILTASNVTLTDFLPAQLSPDTGSLVGGAFDGTNVTWNLGSLAPRRGGQITFQAVVQAGVYSGQLVTNLARIRTTTLESNTNNNSARVVSSILGPACEPLSLAPLAAQIVCQSGSAMFSVVVLAGSAPYHLQWYKQTSLLSGRTNADLVLTDVGSNDAGTYLVVASNACSQVTNTAALTVNPPVTVLQPPTNQAVCPNDNAEFTVQATGASLAYQWYHGADLLPGQTNDTLVVTNMSIADVGPYIVVLSGACGDAVTNTAFLTLNSPLAIIASPTNEDIVAGSNAVFSLVATGTDLDIQWFFNGQLVGSGSRFELDQVTTNQAGIYSVRISGACSEPITQYATLYVLPPEQLLIPPDNQTNCPGDTAVFSITAVGSGIAYQWFHGTNTLPGQTSETLTLTNVSAADAGVYSVVVSGTVGGPVTNSATLTVNEPVLVFTPPAGQTNCPGDTAIFSVEATGTGLRYQWYEDSVELPSATNSILMVSNVASAATVSVVVAGDCGGPITNTATLTVNTPVSALPLVDQATCPAGTAVFTTVASGTGPFTYSWLKDGNLINGQNSSTLLLTNLTAADSAVYAVVVDGACGAVTNSAALVVNSPATASALTSQTNCAGATAVFSTTVTGSGLFALQWFHDRNLLPDQTGTALVISNLSVADTGSYSVVVSGGCGSVTNSASLTVNPATVATPLSNLVRNPGETAVFTTAAPGTGPFAFAWKHNGAPLGGQTSGSLILSNLTYANEGVYSVEVSGACNVATQSASLHINLAPTVKITDPTNGASFIGPANITVAANASDADGTVTNVIFLQGTNVVSQTTNGNPYLLMLTNTPAGTYSFRAIATDNGGLNATSAPIAVYVIARPPLTVITAMHLDLQTGLFEQTVRVSNPTYSVFNAVRVYIYGISSPLTVYNASGVTNGVPYVQSNQGVPPGSYVDFTIEYYVPLAGVVPNPTLVADLVPPGGAGPAVFGTGQHITRGLMLASRTFMVEFVSLTNRIYYIEYSGDLKNWKAAQPAITGNGTSIQWVDNGQPKTESAPAVTPLRFYRLILLPP